MPALAVLADAVRAIDNVVSHINESDRRSSPISPRCSRGCAQLEAELDVELARAAIETSASALVPQLAKRRARRAGCSAAAAARRAADDMPGEHGGRGAGGRAAAEEFDHEIASIYSEEATELIEAAEISLTAWNRDRKDKDRVAELQRQLHTLKGGARMAGISAMGDLSHELETLVIQIDGGTVTADDHAHRRACRPASTSSPACAIW